MTIDINMHDFGSFGFALARLPDEGLTPIWDEVNKIKADFTAATKFNAYLAGSLKKEFGIFDCHSHVEEIAVAMADAYEEYHGRTLYKTMIDRSLKSKLILNDVWVNFQQKHEFIPPHQHAGIYSFVIWLNIPYDIQDEMDYFPDSVPSENFAGKFAFYPVDSLGYIQRHPIPVDRTFNGCMAMWPSSMTHAVFPFYTSDDYRITIAGNLKIGVDNE